MRKEPVADIVKWLEPRAIRGFLVMFISGFLLLLSEPVVCYTATAFRLKFILLILAGGNVMYFHWRLAPSIDQWDRIVPWQAEVVGAFSLVLWLSIVIAGRWTAYEF